MFLKNMSFPENLNQLNYLQNNTEWYLPSTLLMSESLSFQKKRKILWLKIIILICISLISSEVINFVTFIHACISLPFFLSFSRPVTSFTHFHTSFTLMKIWLHNKDLKLLNVIYVTKKF